MPPPDAAVVTTPKRMMTADEFWEFCQRPENENKILELVRGEVIELPNPTRTHGVVANNLGRLLGNHAFAVGVGYVATNDSGVILERDPDIVRGPDVAYYTDAQTFAELHPKWGETPPILAVEVLSPSDKMKKVMQKIADYLDAGVHSVWLVDYEERFVTVYRLHQPPGVVGEDGVLTVEAMPGLECKVADFFRLPGDRSLPPAPPPSA